MFTNKCSLVKSLLIEGDNYKNGGFWRASFLNLDNCPSNYGCIPAYHRDLKWQCGNLNNLCVTVVALCITGLVHYLFLAQWSVIKRQGERCSMRS